MIHDQESNGAAKLCKIVLTEQFWPKILRPVGEEEKAGGRLELGREIRMLGLASCTS